MTAWAVGALGVLPLPSGRLVRGRGLRRPLFDGRLPEFGVYLLNKRPEPVSWEARWVRWPDFRLPMDRRDAQDALRDAWCRAADERVEIACGGGRGRTGTALACLAVLDGVPPREAVAYVREHYDPRAVVGAPLQLSRRFRTRHYAVHRRLGRVLFTSALVAGLFALVFGVPHAWGGAPEAAATVVFGCWFLVCLVLAFRAIRCHDVRHHRRWMVRAFAVGIGVGTSRIWVGIFEGVEQGLSGGTAPATPDPTMFGVAFWLAFTMHVALGEWWLRRTPALTG